MTPRKNLDLEFLRAMAILMTVFQHAEVLVFWPGSWHQRLRHSVGLWTGVDLFFCISGYIITHTLLVGLTFMSGVPTPLIMKDTVGVQSPEG